MTLDQAASNSRTRVHCVGRFLIELPDHFQLQATSDVDLYYGLGPDHRKVTFQALGGGLPTVTGNRVASLQRQHHFRSPTKSLLALHRENGADQRVVWAYEGARTMDTVRVDIFRGFDSMVGKLSEVAFKQSTPELVEARLLALTQRMWFRIGDEPAPRGVCLGSLGVDGSQDGEIVAATFRSSQWADVSIEFLSDSVVQESDGGLLKRWDSRASGLKAAGFSLSTIRRGSVVLADAKAEEIITDGKEGGKLRRDFDAETLPRRSTLAEPQVKVTLRMGGQVGTNYVDPSLDEPTALDFWASVLKSIRRRPGSV